MLSHSCEPLEIGDLSVRLNVLKNTVSSRSEQKAETEQHVKPGDIIYFLEDAQVFGDGSFRSKAIDDRFGCALLLELIGQDLPYDTVFSFVVQEEVGLRGAGVAAAAADPEFALIFEATTAADLPGSEGADRVCTLGGGAVISFIDGRTVYDKALYDLAVRNTASDGRPRPKSRAEMTQARFRMQAAAQGCLRSACPAGICMHRSL